jgi:hypothetical protein
MFTTIMYGFINEVTRQPGGAEIPLRAKHDGRREPCAVRPRRKVRQTTTTLPRHGHVAGKYLVLADSFKRATGFY